MLSAFPVDWFIESVRPDKQVLAFIPGSITVRPRRTSSHAT
jgi:hypothetical protein